jgi:hypothetical protein
MDPNHRSGDLACIEVVYREKGNIPRYLGFGVERLRIAQTRMDGIEGKYSSIPYSFGGKQRVCWEKTRVTMDAGLHGSKFHCGRLG